RVPIKYAGEVHIRRIGSGRNRERHLSVGSRSEGVLVEQDGSRQSLLGPVGFKSIHRNHAEVHVGEEPFTGFGKADRIGVPVVSPSGISDLRSGRDVTAGIGLNDCYGCGPWGDEQRVSSIAGGQRGVERSRAAIGGFY